MLTLIKLLHACITVEVDCVVETSEEHTIRTEAMSAGSTLMTLSESLKSAFI
jgi:hypothetical protein